MKVYSIDIRMDGNPILFATMHEAVSAAHAALEEDLALAEIEIEENQLVPLTKTNVLEIINSGGHHWAYGSHVVEIIKREP